MLRIGDMFSVPLDDKLKKYFQYVADDPSQLNSNVIRAFKDTYPIHEAQELQEIVTGDVDFYTHVIIKWGIKMKLWTRAGNVPFAEQLEVLFKGTNDLLNPGIKKSSQWYVWRVGEPFERVGELKGKNQNAEIGLVVNPPDVVSRMRHGRFEFAYPT